MISRALASVAVAALLGTTGCSGGGGGGPLGGNFVALRTEPANNGTVFLNESIAIDFSNAVDIGTANLNTIAFEVFDGSGSPVSEQVAGVFRLERAPGDTEVGRRLVFEPTLPTNNSYTNGGLRPGRVYQLQIVGGDPRMGNVLLDTGGRTLERPLTAQFTTPTGALPTELFENTVPGGPRRTGFEVSPIDQSGVALNKGGQPPVAVVLKFDEALNPHSENVPTQRNANPLLRAAAPRGRIHLEYDDVEPQPGTKTLIPALVALTSNTRAGSEVTLFPVGVLPNNATVRVMVDELLEDISGESNANTIGYDPEFASFDTRRAYEPQFDAVVESFDDASLLDLDAAFLEPQAEVGRGYIRARFDFAGGASPFDYDPQTSEVVLNTDFTQIQPVGQPPINVSGGVFQFDDVRIRAGVVVKGTGSNPMVWLVNGSLTVDGELSVDGGDGARVTRFRSANQVSAGGTGACGGGRGGRGSPATAGASQRGENGFGPDQVRDGGGRGGLLASCRVQTGGGSAGGSAGGGGAFATAGDPWYPVKSTGSALPQQTGIGGFGCAGTTRGLSGGQPGPLAFADPRDDNDYWGSGVDRSRLVRITGELAAPQGGAGGGGGGDREEPGLNWINNASGGGGGGGGGVLVIRALDTIRIGPSGVIRADGGRGGGGEQSGGNTYGGGGGGGSGGMVVLIAGRKIELVRHGETYANATPTNGGYRFSVSADGGIGEQGQFGGTAISSKYPPPPGATGPKSWDLNAAGGFGGLGVVQLMAPPGTNDLDQTNTVLDDNIDVLDETTNQPLTGAEKIRYLAWRGFPDALGQWVDDFGNPTYFNAAPDDQGDIRPPPILLPSTLGHRTRVRSIWIDTGTSVRRPLAVPDGNPRGIVEDPGNNLLAGPTFTFAGTSVDPSYAGYVEYTRNQPALSVAASYPVVVGPTAVQSVIANATFEGRPSYRVTLAAAVLGNVADAYAQHQARLRDGSGAVVGEYRILSHDQRQLELSPDQGALPGVLSGLRLEVVARFFDLYTDGVPGLGPANPQTVTPLANVQIGFAFHRDATQALSSGLDPNRLPQQVGTFLYDLADPAVQEQVRQLGAAYVKWDVLFNTAFSETDPNNTRQVPPSVDDPRPELRWLVVPYRF